MKSKNNSLVQAAQSKDTTKGTSSHPLVITDDNEGDGNSDRKTLGNRRSMRRKRKSSPMDNSSEPESRVKKRRSAAHTDAASNQIMQPRRFREIPLEDISPQSSSGDGGSSTIVPPSLTPSSMSPSGHSLSKQHSVGPDLPTNGDDSYSQCAREREGSEGGGEESEADKAVSLPLGYRVTDPDNQRKEAGAVSGDEAEEIRPKEAESEMNDLSEEAPSRFIRQLEQCLGQARHFERSRVRAADERATLQGALKTAQEQVAQAEQGKKDVENKLYETFVSLDELTTDRRSLTVALAMSQQNKCAKLDSVKSMLQQRNLEVSGYINDLAGADTRASERESQIKTLEKDRTYLEKRVTELEVSKAAMIQDRKDRAEREVRLRAELHDTQAELHDARQDLEQHRLMREHLESRILTEKQHVAEIFDRLSRGIETKQA